MDPVTIAALSEIAKNFKEKTSENVKKGFEALKGVADSGTLTEFATALNLAGIAAPGLKTIFAEINSETMPNRVAVMQALLDAVKDPDVQITIGHITDFINWALLKLPILIGYLDDIARFVNTIITGMETFAANAKTALSSTSQAAAQKSDMPLWLQYLLYFTGVDITGGGL